jgi:hypothetical protein
VWEVKQIPPGKRVLKAKWVFALKTDLAGIPTQYKARYVAKGFDQVKDKQFDVIFAPTATFVSMRIILAVAASNHWPVHTFDFVAAYFYLPIEEEVWVAPPEGLNMKPGEGCLLCKALYGTKQASRCWWQHLSKTLGALGYSSSQYNASVYILHAAKGNTTIWIHVDNGIVTGLNALEKAYSIEVKWSSDLTDIVGLRVEQSLREFKIHQPKLVASILKEHLDGVSQATTPLPTTSTSTDALKPSKFLSIIGSLSYVSSGSRPDITFAVNFLAGLSKCPDHTHWRALNHLINYLAATKEECLHLVPRPDSPRLACFTDANWGGEFSRSTYWTMVFFLGCPVSWTLKRLATVAASTAHAKYMALGHGTRHVLWIQKLVASVTGVTLPVQMFCDNQATVKICSNDMSNKRTQHTDCDFYITNQALFCGQISLEWVKSSLQFADILTKNLPPLAHRFQFSVVLGWVLARGGGVVA